MGTGSVAPVPKTALIVVDMVQTYDFDEGETLAANVEKMVPALKRLLEKARDAGALIVYVNDSFGDWSTDRERLVARARETDYGHLLDDIAPDDDVLFVLKARHSIFFQTPLDYILDENDIEHIVLAGQTTEQCVLYSALDAHIRHRSMSVPNDAVAHIYDDLAKAALRMMELNMDATVCTVDDVSF
jgi:nicotinamidase-related amidase